MSSIRLDANEWYPVYSIRDDRFGLEVEATAEQIERWAAAEAAFQAAQKEMAELYDAADVVERERTAREKAEADAAHRAEQQRLAEERRLAAEERQAQWDAMWERIRASGSVVYDAEGRRIGEVRESNSGVRLEP